jgi:hypothetical protein
MIGSSLSTFALCLPHADRCSQDFSQEQLDTLMNQLAILLVRGCSVACACSGVGRTIMAANSMITTTLVFVFALSTA